MNMTRSELQQGKALLSKARKLIKAKKPREAINLMLEAFPIKQLKQESSMIHKSK